MGDTYIKPLFALLLHCRTKAYRGLSIRLFTGTAAGLRGRKDDYGAFVLLAPDTGDPIPVEVMRMVSAQLIERLRTGQRDAAVQLLEEKLDRLFSEHGN